jgi:hypothetical protein
MSQTKDQAADISKTPAQRLLVSGRVQLEPQCCSAELQRVMLVLTQEGLDAGIAAALVMNGRSQQITHILLSHVPPSAVYRLAPVSLIDRIDGQRIWLRAPMEAIERLPRHRPD